jgi:ISXO2 transposase-like protein
VRTIIDETVFGKQEGAPQDTSFKGFNFRNVVLTLIERGGSARSFHIEGTTIATLMPILRANIAKETAIMTDEAGWYNDVKKSFASHDTVTHSKGEYVRYETSGIVHSNSVEGYYSIFKRGMKGVISIVMSVIYTATSRNLIFAIPIVSGLA